AEGLQQNGFTLRHKHFFDTLCVEVGDKQQAIYSAAIVKQINLRKVDSDALALSINECSTADDIQELLALFLNQDQIVDITALEQKVQTTAYIPEALERKACPLQHEVFSRYHSETEMLRYLKRL